jgi:hypothetical protein
MSEALKIYEIMWMDYKTVNTVVRVPDSSGNYTVLDFYSGFPYQNGNCENVKEITLLDKWVLENNGTFCENTDFFPSKIPNNIQQCVIKVGTVGIPPFVVLVRNETEEDGNTVYEMRGFMAELFSSPSQK